MSEVTRAPSAKRVPSQSSTSSAAVVLHIIALASLSHSFYQIFQPSPMTEFFDKLEVGGRWVFLTILSLAVSWLTFLFALLKDMFPSVKAFDLAKSMCAIIAVPIEGIVSLLYWGISAIDPNALVPPDPKFQIPLSLDISIHLLPAVLLWTDFLFFSPRLPKQANPLLISAVSAASYVVWMEYASAKNKMFPYPFLHDMTAAQRAVFYVSVIPVVVGLFHAANFLHKIASPYERKRKQL